MLHLSQVLLSSRTMNALNFAPPKKQSTGKTSSKAKAAKLKKKLAELNALKAEVEKLKFELAAAAEADWKKASKHAPVSSVEKDGYKVIYTRRDVLVEEVGKVCQKFYEPSFKVSVDGGKIAPADRQKALNALAKLGIPMKVATGWKPKKDAITLSLRSRSSKVQNFVRSNAGITKSIRVS